MVLLKGKSCRVYFSVAFACSIIFSWWLVFIMQIHASPNRQCLFQKDYEKLLQKRWFCQYCGKKFWQNVANIASIWEWFSCLRWKSTTTPESKNAQKVNEACFPFLLVDARLIYMCQMTESDFKQVRQTFLMKCTDLVGIKLVRNRKHCRMTTLFGTALVCAYILPHRYHRIIDKIWCVWHVQEPMSWAEHKATDYSQPVLTAELKLYLCASSWF